jgi:hypothetical protein
MEPPDQSLWQKVDNKQSPLTVADSAGKGKTSEAPQPPLKAWYLLGPRWGGAKDNEPYGGISIKTQKSEYAKIRTFNAWQADRGFATSRRGWYGTILTSSTYSTYTVRIGIKKGGERSAGYG